MAHIRDLEDNDIDVVIAGESPQWETYEYARDAVQQGKNKAVIFIGHINSEEAGMEYCAGWLKGFIKDIPVKFVASGPSYWTY
jgi:putative NIF3 family GTP cyclohydrolase 1 type 2